MRKLLGLAFVKPISWLPKSSGKGPASFAKTQKEEIERLRKENFEKPRLHEVFKFKK